MKLYDKINVIGEEQTIEQFLRYCSSHAETERALFHKEMIAMAVELAGRPKDYSSPEEWREDITPKGGFANFVSMKEPMKRLVELAYQRAEAEEKIKESSLQAKL